MANADVNGGGRDTADIASCRFEARTESVAEARHFVLEHARLAGRTAEDAALVASELAANAVLHAATAFEVSLHAVGDLLTIAVADGGSVLPAPDPPTAMPTWAPSGRGLLIVSRVAERLGVQPTATGKSVWAELRIRPGDRLGPQP